MKTRMIHGLLLAIAVAWGGAVTAHGQWNAVQRLPSVAPQINDAVVPTSAPMVVRTSDPNLADRVKDLEEALKAIKDKEAAAKKKASGKPSTKVGGRIMADMAVFNQDTGSILQTGNQQNGFEFRRARIFLKGSFFNVFSYKANYDFADGGDRPAFKDVYLQLKELPYVQNFRVGHFKESISMEHLTSSKYNTFMERSLMDRALVPGRNMGMAIFSRGENNYTWRLGIYGDQTPEAEPILQDDNSPAAFTGRVTWLPWYDEATEGRGLIHTGLSYSYRRAYEDEVDFRTEPEAHLCDNIFDTGPIACDDYQLYGAEMAFVYGPFSVQTEAVVADVNRIGAARAKFSGCYVNLSYFLTGENRVYDRGGGYWARIKPFENFFRVRDENGYIFTGKGAWEIAYRYSYLDLNDQDIIGGRGSDHTLGVNWYLNPYTRVMLNYVHSDLRNTEAASPAVIDGSMDIFQMRAQVDF